MKIPHMILAGLWLLAAAGCDSGSSASSGGGAPDPQPPAEDPPPNILLIVVDDAGVDQFEAFGYGGAVPAATDSINAIAEAGVRFRNAWSMPTCSPTRTVFFDGRYPFRNNVRNAIVSTDLANSQISPYHLTLPRLLKEEAGYTSALIGKMHLTGSEVNPDNNPLGDTAIYELGWDYYAGYQDGAPHPVDTTAGGVAPEGTHQCGFVPNTTADSSTGADFGICYLPGGDHLEMLDVDTYPTPGRSCVELGGIFDPGATHYTEERRAQLDFDTQNGYYVSELKVSHPDGSSETWSPADPRVRGYRSTLEADLAINWIQQTEQEQPDTPWMMSLGFSALHAPLQPPPAELLPHPDAELSLLGCGTPVTDGLAEVGIPASGNAAEFAQQRAVAQHMLEAVDHEIGRLLVETGIADRREDGSLQYNPDSNTVVVFTSDNGTYMPSVKLPFDPMRAKGTLYQSGVWVPLLVTGPAVESPDRDVPHMVNSTDLYSLFRELAGIDESRLPDYMQLDAQPLMPYLENPGQAAIRATNFTEQGTNISAVESPPCVIPQANVCVQIFPQAEVCHDQSGDWYGPGSEANPAGFASCCAVNEHLVAGGGEPVDIFPHQQRALRDEHYKLVRISRLDCATDTLVDSEEFYAINESTDPRELKIDREEDNLLANATPDDLTGEQRASLDFLSEQLDTLLDSHIDCPGDGNGDLAVDQRDLDEWAWWADPQQGGGLSSWYDLDHDGRTDGDDKAIIEANMGRDCQP